jgi:hypothetical protein
MWDDDIAIKLKHGHDQTDPKNWQFEDENDDIVLHDECIQDRFYKKGKT